MNDWIMSFKECNSESQQKRSAQSYEKFSLSLAVVALEGNEKSAMKFIDFALERSSSLIELSSRENCSGFCNKSEFSYHKSKYI